MSHRSRKPWIVVLLVVLGIAIGWDLAGPVRSSLRVYDPRDVARLETDMWRAYYEKKPALLYLQMADLLRRQYHLPWLRSYVVAYDAARAAFVFKRGRDRDDYERALPDLERYYRRIRAVSDLSFDVSEVARLELEWWIVHRERLRRPEGELATSLAALQTSIYREPGEVFVEHAEARARAMVLRDESAAAGGTRESDWREIRRLLELSWASHRNAVRPGPTRREAYGQ